MSVIQPTNATYADEEMRLWQEYRRSSTLDNLGKLLDRFSGASTTRLQVGQFFPA